jgi:glutamyl-tRNA synthetase
MHLGNASTALLVWLSVRSRGGSLVMRMEDLDRPRVVSGAAERILADTAWLGLDWDEGPDRGGPHVPYEQGKRGDRYRQAFDALQDAGRVYPCFCSRKDIAAAASAPQAPGDEILYPGTCRDLDPGEADRRVRAGERHSWRFRVEPDRIPAFHDLVLGRCDGTGRRRPGDFVVQRFDGTAAYQLAVVVDDTEMGIDEVVRGDDLVSSGFRQVLLYDALGLRTPVFGHVPLLLGPDGVRLSKRHEGTSLHELREAGWSASEVVGTLASLLGLTDLREPVEPRDLLPGFSLDRVRRVDGGIVLPRRLERPRTARGSIEASGE